MRHQFVSTRISLPFQPHFIVVRNRFFSNFFRFIILFWMKNSYGYLIIWCFALLLWQKPKKCQKMGKTSFIVFSIFSPLLLFSVLFFVHEHLHRCHARHLTISPVRKSTKQPSTHSSGKKVFAHNDNNLQSGKSSSIFPFLFHQLELRKILHVARLHCPCKCIHSKLVIGIQYVQFVYPKPINLD